MGVYVNPKTQQDIDRLVKKLPHALLIVGGQALGSMEVARELAELVGGSLNIVLPEKKDKVDLEAGVVGVDQIRRLYDSTRVRRKTKDITIIQHGDRLTHQAQNAFLKLLEEPNQNTHFMILVDTTERLLDTVLSRVERLELRPITRQHTEEIIASFGVSDTAKRTQLLYMAEGMPNELVRLIEDEDYFDHRSQSVRSAMSVLRGTDYQKLQAIHEVRDSRSGALGLARDVASMLRRLIYDNPSADLLSRLDSTLEAIDLLERNGNIRLTLTKAFL